MRRLIIVVAWCVFGSSLYAGNGRILEHPDPVKGQYIVRLTPVAQGEVEPAVRALVRQYKVKLSRKPDGSDSIMKHGMQGFSGSIKAEDAVALARDPRVEMVEQDAWVKKSADQYLTDSRQWNLDRVDQTVPVAQGDSWYSYQTTGQGVHIYVLDAGVERNHIEFDDDNNASTTQVNPRVRDGVSFVSGWDTYPAWRPCGSYVGYNDFGASSHGTAVASVAAGKTVGIAKGAYIVPVKVIACDGYSKLEWLCWALDWIAGPSNPYPKQPAVVSISMYLNLTAYNYYDNPQIPASSFEHTVNNVIGAGTAVIVSANNQGGNACNTSPARLSYTNTSYGSTHRVISVGGTDRFDRLWRCSDWGECVPVSTELGSNTGQCVDLYAPAHNVMVAHNSAYSTYRPAVNSGTSFSAPYVAGIAARILQWNPYLTPALLRTAITNRSLALPANFDGDGVYSNDRLAHIAWTE